MKIKKWTRRVLWTTLCFFGGAVAMADPCGMVPPIYVGDPPVLARIGEQQTYVFFKDGIETFVIRPGFRGDVDTFGMLIPFPTPPAIRKVPDNIFSQLAAAVDPPEVKLYLHPPYVALKSQARMMNSKGHSLGFGGQQRDRVRVLRQEAVGMYEVAVLAAGSSAALKKWMNQNGYQYPTGMDRVCDDYVEADWCFVAVKSKVGQKGGVDPKPAQRALTSKLPKGATFDGHVQGMGFRFKTEQLVVPMRLSAFNEGELRNIVYLLTTGPRQINNISQKYVVRQIPGERLYRNLTDPLPLRLIGGNEQDIKKHHLIGLAKRRNPDPKNGEAKRLFAADLLAVGSDTLSLPQEETEKDLLAVGEHFGLRGAAIDKLHAETIKADAEQTVQAGLDHIKEMTLTVIDGDFPRNVIAEDNLTFAAYKMPEAQNNAERYDAKIHGPAGKQRGILKLGEAQTGNPLWRRLSLLLFGGVGLLLWKNRRSRGKLLSALLLTVIFLPAGAHGEDPSVGSEELANLIGQLNEQGTAAVEKIATFAARDPESRRAAVRSLEQLANSEGEYPTRGWAIAALSEIPGQDVEEMLLGIQSDPQQAELVRTWAAAARVSRVRSAAALIEKADLIAKFPALARPIGKRLVTQLTKDSKNTSPAALLALGLRVPTLGQALAPLILAAGPEKLTEVMLHAKDQQVRRQAAAYLGTLAAAGNRQVATEVTNACRFDPQAKEVPWNGGPLFLPALTWQRNEARTLVGNLIRWYLWCDRHGMAEVEQQIHNNLRSLSLANAARYESPGWQPAGAILWLKTWSAAAGRGEVERILKEQGVFESNRYRTALQ